MKTHLDLFSGIGGFALAARWAGIETVQFVEIDPFCQKVLAKNFKGVPIHDDIKTFTYAAHTDDSSRRERKNGECQEIRERETVGVRYVPSGVTRTIGERSRPFLLTGGFPCQPFSCAGKRRGKEDDRYLWPEMLRVVSEARPTWVIGENVAGFINMGLDDCISDLEGEGYEVQAFIIPACAVNAPHRRDRVWICAHSINGEHGTGRGQDGETDSLQGINRETLCSGRIERTDSHAPDTNLIGCGNTPQRYGSPCLPTGTWEQNWLEVATRLCRVDARVSNRVDRLKSLGNAIVPQVAYEIMRAIMPMYED